MKYFKFTICIIFLCTLPQYVFAYTNTLTLAIVSPSHAKVYKISQAVLREALKRNGYNLILKIYPPRRAELLAESGGVDGEAHRIYHFGKNHPELVRVPEPVQSTRQSVFTRKLNFKVKGWKSLASYKVIYVGGFKVVEKGLRGVVNEDNIIVTDTIETAFKMLAQDRGELLITSPETGFATLEKLSLQDKGIKVLSPPVQVIELYTYLHKKHAGLAEKLALSIKEMKADGSYENILKKIEKDLN